MTEDERFKLVLEAVKMFGIDGLSDEDLRSVSATMADRPVNRPVELLGSMSFFEGKFTYSKYGSVTYWGNKYNRNEFRYWQRPPDRPLVPIYDSKVLVDAVRDAYKEYGSSLFRGTTRNLRVHLWLRPGNVMTRN